MNAARRTTHDQWSTSRLLAVGLGATVGALLRALVGQYFPVTGDELPLGTLLVNITGCLAMGLITPPLRRVTPLAALALTTGVLGGYTTFSTFALDAFHLADPAPVMLVTYVLLTVIGCVGGAVAGLVAGEQLFAEKAAR